MWTCERTLPGGQPYRAFVSLPGHLDTNFARPNYRAILLRGMAWAGKRPNVDEFCTPEELASLRYPEGGPTAPDQAAAKLEVHPEFNISLVAAEPLITKPINIDWDPQGRLWVAETPEYPNGRRALNVEPWKDAGSVVRSGSFTNRPARDRISILTDTDGDGRADKKEIFFEGLELVTSFVFHQDGVIASAAPDIWWIRDTDGDGKADKTERLYTGLGTRDTHAVINNLRWGFDGWIYATHGYSGTDHVTNGDGSRDYGRLGSGVVRFKPDGSAFEQVCSKGGNTWGLDIAWDNEVFFTQPTSGDLLIHVVLPESVLARGQVPGTRSFKPLIVRRKSFPLLNYDQQVLEHPNRHVRNTAVRLLVERGGFMTGQAADSISSSQRAEDTRAKMRLLTLVSSGGAAEARVAALWALHRVGQLPPAMLATLANDPNPALRKNALEALVQRPAPARGITQAVIERLQDPDRRVQLKAWVALGSAPLQEEAAEALVDLYPKLNDPSLESAALAAAAQNPRQCIQLAFSNKAPPISQILVGQLAGMIGAKQDSAAVADLVVFSAHQPASTDTLKITIYTRLAEELKRDALPPLQLDLQQALQKLLSDPNPSVSAAALPLVGHWDKQGALAAGVNKLVAELTAKLNGQSLSEDTQARVIASLLGVRQMKPEIVPLVAKLIGPPASAELQRRIIEAFGATGDPAVGPALATAYPRLSAELRGVAFGQILKRADWSLAFLEAMQAGAVPSGEISPVDFYRLRTHPDAAVAARGGELWLKGRGGEAAEKGALLAKFTPAILQSGDVKNGQELFKVHCATCHQLGELGSDVGPVLTGMGAHGPAELLVQILDPNREVDPSYVSYDIETKDGEMHNGIIARENAANVVLKNANSEKQIPVGQIRSRRSTGRSVMPEGFEALGAEAMRDLLAFVCVGESRFRFVDLSSAFTASSRHGLYQSVERTNDTLKFRKFGPVTVEGVPFNIVAPTRSAGGKNLAVLKGGPNGSFAKALPQRVEAKVGFSVRKLHFLGGVAGWGFPGGGGQDVPVMKVTVHYAGGEKEELVMRNGVEFADYTGGIDVPGSKLAEDVVTSSQVRWFSKPLNRSAMVEKLELESFNNGVAPTTVAITAELRGTGASSPAAVRQN